MRPLACAPLLALMMLYSACSEAHGPRESDDLPLEEAGAAEHEPQDAGLHDASDVSDAVAFDIDSGAREPRESVDGAMPETRRHVCPLIVRECESAPSNDLCPMYEPKEGDPCRSSPRTVSTACYYCDADSGALRVPPGVYYDYFECRDGKLVRTGSTCTIG